MIPAERDYPEATVSTKRRSLGWKMIGSMNALNDQAVGLGYHVDQDEVFLTAKEAETVRKVVKHLEACKKTLDKLSAGLGVDR